MADPIDWEALDAAAGEYVLGTLEGDERRDFLRRLAREPDAVAAVRTWQGRLAPLGLAIPSVFPPDGLFDRIERAIGDMPPSWGAVPVTEDKSASRWRAMAIAAAMVAVIGSGVAVRNGFRPPAPPPALPTSVRPVSFAPSGIAALSAAGKTPGLFVTYDRASGKIRVVPVGLADDPSHSFELWLIQGKNAPKPLGLVEAGRSAERGVGLPVAGNDTFAVSLEPIGGSRTGVPTGPVLYSGMLMTVPPTA